MGRVGKKDPRREPEKVKAGRELYAEHGPGAFHLNCD